MIRAIPIAPGSISIGFLANSCGLSNTKYIVIADNPRPTRNRMTSFIDQTLLNEV